MTKVAVLDIGKTNLKLALVDTQERAERAVETAPNAVLRGDPWPHFDVAAQRAFLFSGLKKLASRHPIDAIAVTTHGACAALLDARGNLAAPVLDYEFDGPDKLRHDYDKIRPPFSETGSPALPMGLNLGAQVHFMLAVDPSLRNRLASIVTWPQYWGFLLTGNQSCDLSSLGCHTDLWNPFAGEWSSLVAQLGLQQIMAPARRSAEVLGPLRPELQAEWGLGPVPVAVGIHDSNASLLPHLLQNTPPFSVVSTGTWVISMAIGGMGTALDPGRDTLVNVDAFGGPVPSARFMGGREYAEISRGKDVVCTSQDEAAVLSRGVMLLPSVVPDCGPFPGKDHRWTMQPATAGERGAALGFYLGLMTAECLLNIGAKGPTIIEGPFGRNQQFLTMLASATGRQVTASTARTGTAIGAALLCAKDPSQPAAERRFAPDPRLTGYAKEWRRLASL